LHPRCIIVPYEIILVDDRPRAQRDELHDLIEQQPRVSIYALDRHRGVQAARALGFSKARYKYVVNLDADDKLNCSPDILSVGTYFDQAIALLESDPSAAYVHSYWQMFQDFGGLTRSSYPVTTEMVLRKHHVPTSIVFRHSDGLGANLYAPSILKWRDWSTGVALLNSRFSRHLPNKIACLRSPYYLYRVHNDKRRLSNRVVDEAEMIRRTVYLYREIFIQNYQTHDLAAISRRVYESKPDRLTDLLYMASNNLQNALSIKSMRGLSISNNPPNIP